MALPERIDGDALARVYAAIGFSQAPDEPATFTGPDEVDIYHDPDENGMFIVVFVLLDVRAAAAFYGLPTLHERFFEALLDEVG